MGRKTLIRRAALIGVVVLGTSGLLALGGYVFSEIRWDDHLGRMNDHVQEITKEYQAYLDETAQKIKGLPVDPKVIGEIQTRHYRETPGRWGYVWASTNAGEFLFGVPADAFTRLNTAYDQYQEVIAQDNHFANRDQFLRWLLHSSRSIALKESPRDPSDERESRSRGTVRNERVEWWRFFSQDEARRGNRSNALHLSTPIQDAKGATVGNLNLKLVDERDPSIYWTQRTLDERGVLSVLMPIAGILCGFSLVWLWFLLPSWVYIDARERDVPRPLLWTALTLVGNVFALMVYLISRPTDVREFRCPQCAKALNGAKAGCPYCGFDLSTVFCPQCQYPVKPDWSFCPSCRGSLSRSAVVSGEAAK